VKTTRRYVAIVMPSLILLELAACGSGVPPRSAALDPSNVNGPESPPFSGSSGLTENQIAADGQIVHDHQGNAASSEQHAGHDPAAANAAFAQPSSAMQADSSDQPGTYTCPMHPEVKSARPGQCPKCGMKLIFQGKQPAPAPAAPGSAPTGKDERTPTAVVYTCPMHPEVTSSQTGKCPKCGANLLPKKDDR
jgi:hypothetical protein